MDEFTTRAAKEDSGETIVGRIRKKSSAFLSPWASAWRVDPSTIDVISAPGNDPRSWAGSHSASLVSETHYENRAHDRFRDFLFLAALFALPIVLFTVLLWVLFA